MIQLTAATQSSAQTDTNVVVDYIVLTKSHNEGSSAWIPGLPGCWSDGATDDEALSRVSETVAEILSDACGISLKRSADNTHTLSVSLH